MPNGSMNREIFPPRGHAHSESPRPTPRKAGGGLSAPSMKGGGRGEIRGPRGRLAGGGRELRRSGQQIRREVAEIRLMTDQQELPNVAMRAQTLDDVLDGKATGQRRTELDWHPLRQDVANQPRRLLGAAQRAGHDELRL